MSRSSVKNFSSNARRMQSNVFSSWVSHTSALHSAPRFIQSGSRSDPIVDTESMESKRGDPRARNKETNSELAVAVQSLLGSNAPSRQKVEAWYNCLTGKDSSTLEGGHSSNLSSSAASTSAQEKKREDIEVRGREKDHTRMDGAVYTYSSTTSSPELSFPHISSSPLPSSIVNRENRETVSRDIGGSAAEGKARSLRNRSSFQDELVTLILNTLLEENTSGETGRTGMDQERRMEWTGELRSRGSNLLKQMKILESFEDSGASRGNPLVHRVLLRAVKDVKLCGDIHTLLTNENAAQVLQSQSPVYMASVLGAALTQLLVALLYNAKEVTNARSQRHRTEGVSVDIVPVSHAVMTHALTCVESFDSFLDALLSVSPSTPVHQSEEYAEWWIALQLPFLVLGQRLNDVSSTAKQMKDADCKREGAIFSLCMNRLTTLEQEMIRCLTHQSAKLISNMTVKREQNGESENIFSLQRATSSTDFFLSVLCLINDNQSTTGRFSSGAKRMGLKSEFSMIVTQAVLLTEEWSRYVITQRSLHSLERSSSFKKNAHSFFPAKLVYLLGELLNLSLPSYINKESIANGNNENETANILCHRTCHTALNSYLSDLWEHVADGSSGTNHSKPELSELWLSSSVGDTPLLGTYLLRSLQGLLQEVGITYFSISDHESFAATATTLSDVLFSTSFMRQMAVLTRIVLQLEEKVSFMLYRHFFLLPSMGNTVDAMDSFLKGWWGSSTTSKKEEHLSCSSRISTLVEEGTKSKVTSGSRTDDFPDEQAQRDLLALCLRLRASSCEFVDQAVLFWSSIGQSGERAGSQLKEHVRRKRSKEGNAQQYRHQLITKNYFGLCEKVFYSLLRRHYLFSTLEGKTVLLGRNTKGVLSASDEAMQLESVVQSTCLHWLNVFLLLRDVENRERAAEPSFKKAPKAGNEFPEDDWSGKGEDVPVKFLGATSSHACGTSLIQALDVAYFLCACAQRWPSTFTSHAVHVSTQDIHLYIQEVFVKLEHSTARQLWSLRTSGCMFYFTGERIDRSYLVDPIVRRRHALSTLAVSLSHVKYPSILWMPLWQLQEMFSLLAAWPFLLFDLENSKDTTGVGNVEGMDSDLTEDALDATLMQAVGATAKGDRPMPQRVTVTVGELSSDLSAFHRYLMQRLFVMSNVLRQWRREWLGILEQNCSGDGDNNPGSAVTLPDHWRCTTFMGMNRGKRLLTPKRERFVEALTRLSGFEPETERAAAARGGAQHRSWAKETVKDILQNPVLCRMAAEVEGVADEGWGVVRCLQRLERMIQTASSHGLLYTASRDEKRPKLVMQTGNMGDTACDNRLPQRILERGSRSHPPGTAEEGAEIQGAEIPVFTLILHRRHDTKSPLGFTLQSDTAVITQVEATMTEESLWDPERIAEAEAPDVEKNNLGRPTPLALAASAAGVEDIRQLIGLRVGRVDGVAVSSGRDVAMALGNGRETFELKLFRPSKE